MDYHYYDQAASNYNPYSFYKGRKKPNPLPPQLQLAEAYVLYQHYNTIFDPREGLTHGTIFPELVRTLPAQEPRS